MIMLHCRTWSKVSTSIIDTLTWCCNVEKKRQETEVDIVIMDEEFFIKLSFLNFRTKSFLKALLV